MKIRDSELPTLRSLRCRSERVAMERDYHLRSGMSSAEYGMSDEESPRSLHAHRVSFFSEYSDVLGELVS